MSTHIKFLLPLIFKEEQWKMQLFSEWEKIVGPLASKIRIEKVENGILSIGVYHAVWLQELYHLSNVLKNSINKHLGGLYIKNIHLRHATKAKPVEKKIAETKTIIYNDTVSLTENEKVALKKIKDIELQTALHLFLSRCYYQKINQSHLSAQLEENQAATLSPAYLI